MSPTDPNESIAQLIDALGVDDTRDLVRLYLEEYSGLIRTMVSGDRESQHRATHSLKSSSRHMGLVTLVRRLEALEARLFLPTGKVTAQDIETITGEFEKAVLPLRRDYDAFLLSVDAGGWLTLKTLIWDARFGVATAFLAGFGRALAEVGAVLIVGGNINGLTRVMTTTIALETSKGNLELALALGAILLGIAIAINASVHALARFGRRYEAARE